MADFKLLKTGLVITLVVFTLSIYASYYVLNHHGEYEIQEVSVWDQDYVQPTCNTHDSAALLEFKTGFICLLPDHPDSDEGCRLRSWSPGTNCCGGWEGVECDAAGRVSHLYFYDEYSNYTIVQNTSDSNFMAVLSRLTSLRAIAIDHVRFRNARIPREWGQLTNLKYIRLSQVPGLALELPRELGDLGNLESFEFSISPETVNERESTNGSAGIPEELCKLRKLRLFWLQFTDWAGTLPSCIEGWKSIESIYIEKQGTSSTGGLTGSLPYGLGNLKSLERLDLTGNKLTGAIPDSFKELTGLVRLDLSRNSLSGAVPLKALSHLKLLEEMDLSSNGFNESLSPLPADSFPSLEILDISNNHLTGEIPEGLFDQPRLYNIKLQNNSLSGPIPSAARTDLPSFIYDLSNNNLSGPLPAILPGTTGYLYASNNKLTGAIPENYASLRVLDLSFNKLSGTVPALLQSIDSLCLEGNDLEVTLNLAHCTGFRPVFPLNSSSFRAPLQKQAAANVLFRE